MLSLSLFHLFLTCSAAHQQLLQLLLHSLSSARSINSLLLIRSEAAAASGVSPTGGAPSGACQNHQNDYSPKRCSLSTHSYPHTAIRTLRCTAVGTLLSAHCAALLSAPGPSSRAPFGQHHAAASHIGVSPSANPSTAAATASCPCRLPAGSAHTASASPS